MPIDSYRVVVGMPTEQCVYLSCEPAPDSDTINRANNKCTCHVSRSHNIFSRLDEIHFQCRVLMNALDPEAKYECLSLLPLISDKMSR